MRRSAANRHMNKRRGADIVFFTGGEITMSLSRRIVSSAIIMMSMYIFSMSPLCRQAKAYISERRESMRMENVRVNGESCDWFSSGAQKIPVLQPVIYSGSAARQEPSAPPQPSPEPIPASGGMIIPTTIEGGLTIKNQTSYQINMGQLIRDGTDIRLKPGTVQILIIHTHSSEAYTPVGIDTYEASDVSRTEDTNYNVVRIGDELTEILTAAGLNVLHDRGIYDYPSYTGSYTRSGQAVAQHLAQNPDIRIVIDIHRDSLGENGVIYKTLAEGDESCASQVMLLVGTDESGLAHDNWRQNLSLAMYLQKAVSGTHPTLMRPVMLVPQRYNQHLTPGSLILEVGSDGNTLQEALTAVRLFGAAAAPALAALVESAE